MTHFIRQQYLHVDLQGSESDGFALQNQLTDLYYRKLVPVIEDILDQSTSAGSHLKIDKLEIDAGTISLDRLEYELANAVAEALRKSIKNVAGKAILNTRLRDNEGTYIRSDRENLWDVFTCFLSAGSLPWSYKLPEGKSLEEVISGELLSNQSGSGGAVPAKKIIEVLKSENAAKRLTLQFSDVFIRRLLHQVSPELFLVIKELEELLQSADDITLTQDRLQFLKKLVLQKGILQLTSSLQVGKVEIIRNVLWELRTMPESELIVSKIFAPVLSEVEKSSIVRKEEVKQTFEEIVLQKQPAGIVIRTEEIQNTDIKHGIFIDNAGLVLLHPFLLKLFEELGIAGEDAILRPERALSLLHYLVTGETESPEYELVLPKILCGISLTEPVPLTVAPDETEQIEASNLLGAVIQHWEALRSTTPDGLRGNFLVRPGKVSRKDDGDWLLQVESREFDILLDQLPWGISMIKLPWMKDMLWVEWRI